MHALVQPFADIRQLLHFVAAGQLHAAARRPPEHGGDIAAERILRPHVLQRVAPAQHRRPGAPADAPERPADALRAGDALAERVVRRVLARRLLAAPRSLLARRADGVRAQRLLQLLETVLGHIDAGCGGHAVPDGRLPLVARGVLAEPVEIAERVLRQSLPLLGGTLEPADRLLHVPGHAAALAVHLAEVVLRLRIALLGGLPHPVRSLGLVERRVAAEQMHHAQVVLRQRLALVGGLGQPAHRLLRVLAHPGAGVEHGA